MNTLIGRLDTIKSLVKLEKDEEIAQNAAQRVGETETQERPGDTGSKGEETLPKKNEQEANLETWVMAENSPELMKDRDL